MAILLTIETLVSVVARPVNAEHTSADGVKAEADGSGFRTRGSGGAADRADSAAKFPALQPIAVPA